MTDPKLESELPGWGEPPPLPRGIQRQTADNSDNQEGHATAPIDLPAAYRGEFRINLDEIQYTPEEFPEGPYGSPWVDR